MFQLNLRESKPLYEQIKGKIKELIINNIFKPDERIPSVRELAQSLTINPNTIHKAYKELEADGLIYSIPGKGNFVTPLEQQQQIIPTRREELKHELEKILTELLYLQEPEEQLLSYIQTIYKKKEVKKND